MHHPLQHWGQQVGTTYCTCVTYYISNSFYLQRGILRENNIPEVDITYIAFSALACLLHFCTFEGPVH